MPVEFFGDEELSPNHEVYIIDSFGARHDYILDNIENGFEGFVDLQGYPSGITYIYGRFSDTVGNLSDLICKTFLIGFIENVICEVSIEEYKVKIDTQVSVVDMVVVEIMVDVGVEESKADMTFEESKVEMEMRGVD
jgi:hypothetical protein